jgi:hypothetical protein
MSVYSGGAVLWVKTKGFSAQNTRKKSKMSYEGGWAIVAYMQDQCPKVASMGIKSEEMVMNGFY